MGLAFDAMLFRSSMAALAASDQLKNIAEVVTVTSKKLALYKGASAGTSTSV